MATPNEVVGKPSPKSADEAQVLQVSSGAPPTLGSRSHRGLKLEQRVGRGRTSRPIDSKKRKGRNGMMMTHVLEVLVDGSNCPAARGFRLRHSDEGCAQ